VSSSSKSIDIFSDYLSLPEELCKELLLESLHNTSIPSVLLAKTLKQRKTTFFVSYRLLSAYNDDGSKKPTNNMEIPNQSK